MYQIKSFDDLFQAYLDEMQANKSDDIKFTISLSKSVNDDLVDLAQHLNITRAQLSRDLIRLALEHIKVDVFDK